MCTQCLQCTVQCTFARLWANHQSSIHLAKQSIQSSFWTFPFESIEQMCLCELVSHSSSSPGPSPVLTTDPVKPHSQTSLDPPKSGTRAKPQALDRRWRGAEQSRARNCQANKKAHSLSPNSASRLFLNSYSFQQRIQVLFSSDSSDRQANNKFYRSETEATDRFTWQEERNNIYKFKI